MANNNPKISVIVPVYNVEKYLPRCIDSILTQTFTDFELLIIDDGSTDNSSKICDEYAKKDARVRVFHKENGGVGSARNMGICEAKGQWICFVDSDDWLEINCYSSLMEDDDVADLTYFGCCCRFIDGGSTSYSPPSFYSIDRNKVEEKLACLKDNTQHFEYLGYTWNKLFRKDIIDRQQIFFINGLTLREDELFTLSYARYATSLRVKSDILYNYRVITTGLSNSIKSIDEYLSFSKQLSKILSRYSNCHLLRLEYNAMLFYLFVVMSNERTLSKRWLRSINTFVHCGRYVKMKYGITSLRLVIPFKVNCFSYQYVVSAGISILCNYKKKINGSI